MINTETANADELGQALAYLADRKTFHDMDRTIFTSMATFYNTRKMLTPRQADYARTLFRKRWAHYNTALTKFEYQKPKVATVTADQKSGVDLDEKGENLIVRFDYSPALIDDMRTISGRKFTKPNIWTVPLDVPTFEKVRGFGISVSEAALLWYRKAKQKAPVIKDYPNIKVAMRPYQKQGASTLLALDGRAFLADEMGLGKSLQVLAYLTLVPDVRPAIILCPATVKANWLSEILSKTTFKEKDVAVIHGTKRAECPYLDNRRIIIVNYDIVSHWVDTLALLRARLVVLDEAHYIANKTKRTKSVQKLCAHRPRVIAVSGTPIINRPREMFNALNLVSPRHFPSFWQYAQRYCGARKTYFGWDFNGCSNTKELFHKLKNTIMIRRMKADVLPDLPPKQRTVVILKPTGSSRLLQKAQRIEEMSDKTDEIIAQIEDAKQAAATAKMPEALEFITNILEQDDKVLVFAIHKKVVSALETGLADYHPLRITGSETLKQRKHHEDLFQNTDKHRVCIGNIKAAGVGITLTAAKHVVFVEYPWTPGELDQAEDRAHRFGQKDSVNVYYLILENTIEADLIECIDEKRRNVTQIVNGDDVKSGDMLEALLKRMQRRRALNLK